MSREISYDHPSIFRHSHHNIAGVLDNHGFKFYNKSSQFLLLSERFSAQPKCMGGFLMKIDRGFDHFFKRISSPVKYAFFSCLIVGYLVHLYCFTNLIPNTDGISRMFDYQQMTVSGRWSLHFASYINAFTQMPAAIGLFSIVLLSLSSAFIVDLLEFRNRYLAMFVGIVIAGFPALGYTFLYMFTASAYCLAILGAVLSVWFVHKGGKLNWAIGVMLLTVSMGIYQVYVSFAISLSIVAIIRELYKEETSFKSVLQKGLSFISYLAVSALFYCIILKIFLKIKNIELLSYLGMDEAFSNYPLQKIPGLIKTVYIQYLSFFFRIGTDASFSTKYTVILHLLLLTGVIILIVYCMVKVLAKERWRTIGMIAILAILPLGMGFGQILSPFSPTSVIMKYSFCITYIFILVAVDAVDIDAKYIQKTTCTIMVVLSALVLSFVNTNNILYTTTTQAHRATESYLTRIMARIEDCPDYTPGMEVVIIGTIPQTQLQSQLESYNRVYHYSVPQHTVVVSNYHFYNYYNDWLNIPMPAPSEEVMISVSNSPEFKAMPLYPEAGSVQVHDGRVIVKISETYTPKPEYVIDYENRK